MLRKLPSDDFAKTLNKFTDQKENLKKDIKSFLEFKDSNPNNGFIPGQKGYGKMDSKFKPTGFFKSKIPDISHAHLTHNISIVYLIKGEFIYLYGIYTHDDIGTGTPPNDRRSDQMAQRWSNMQFNQELDTSVLNPKTSDSKSSDSKSSNAGNKISYAPKAKQAKASSQSPRSLVDELAKQADSIWPQRRIIEKLNIASTSAEIQEVLAAELRYVQSLRQAGKKLYPNQLSYVKILQNIASKLS